LFLPGLCTNLGAGVIFMTEETKVCSNCGLEKPLNTEHFRYRSKRCVFEAKCRKCQIEENKAYYLNNKEKVKQRKRNRLVDDGRRELWGGARIRAKSKGIPFTITIDDIVIPEVCPVLGIKLEHGVGYVCDNSPTLDRIIPELGYVVGNIQVISHRANTIKNNASLEDMIKVVEHMKRVTHLS
jgi:hypothetical protein